MAASINGDPLSNTYKWLIFSKQKHNNDYGRVIMHYYKHNYAYYISFLAHWAIKLACHGSPFTIY